MLDFGTRGGGLPLSPCSRRAYPRRRRTVDACFTERTFACFCTCLFHLLSELCFRDNVKNIVSDACGFVSADVCSRVSVFLCLCCGCSQLTLRRQNFVDMLLNKSTHDVFWCSLRRSERDRTTPAAAYSICGAMERRTTSVTIRCTRPLASCHNSARALLVAVSATPLRSSNLE